MTTHQAIGQAHTSIANATLPARVRQILAKLMDEVRNKLEEETPHILRDAELALVNATPLVNADAAAARNTAIRSLGSGIRTFNRRVLGDIETSLVNLKAAATTQVTRDRDAEIPLSLLDDENALDDTVLDMIGSRIESRNSLALQLLGFRFGVLAGAPALEGKTLPLGPHALCEALRNAADAIDVTGEAREVLFNKFERALFEFYPELIEAVNHRFVTEGVLPHLRFIPLRARPGPRVKAGAAPEPDVAAASLPTPTPAQAHSPPPTQPPQTASKLVSLPLSRLRDLLAQRRALLARMRPQTPDTRVRDTLPHEAVLEALHRLRRDSTKADSVSEYRQILLAQARQLHGHGVALSDVDNDNFELLDMFQSQLQREVRKSSPGDVMISHLQVPLLQTALRDPQFFSDAHHPARELLSAVSRAGAMWLSDDDLDSQWLDLLQRAVATVKQDRDSTPTTIESANKELQSGLQAMSRKTDMVERRHIEAARGREKLEVARRRAQVEVARRTEGRNLPPFHTALLEQAWVDVLSLAHLRNGERSTDWHKLLEITTRLIDSSTPDGPPLLSDDDLSQVRTALEQIGYHADGAATITQELAAKAAPTNSTDSDAIHAAAMEQLQARTRLGEGSAPRAESTDSDRPLSPAEQMVYDELAELTEPVWIELSEDGVPIRRRMVWISTVTDQVLLLNRRGQHPTVANLRDLARSIVAGQMRILLTDAAPAETAWTTIVESLQHLAPAGSLSRQGEP